MSFRCGADAVAGGCAEDRGERRAQRGVAEDEAVFQGLFGDDTLPTQQEFFGEITGRQPQWRGR